MSPERASRTFKVTEIIPQFFRRLGKTRRLIPLQITLLCLDGAIHSTVPAITGYIIDQLNTDPATFISEKLIWLAPGVVVLSLLYYSCVASQHYLANRIYRSAGVRFQVELYRHLQSLSADFYQRNHVGEITSRLTNDINTGVMPLYPQLTMIIWCLSLLIPAAVSMFFISRPLFCIFLGTAVIFIILTRVIIPYIRRLNRQMQDEAGRINARITENVSANSLIRAFAQEANFTDQVNQHTQVFLSKALRTARVSIFFADIMTMFLTVLSPLGILLAGAYFIRQGVSIGALVAASLYWRLATVPINSLLNQITVIFATFGSMDRVLEFFHETPLVADDPEAEPLKVTKSQIEFRNINFRYPVTDGDIVLDNLNLTAYANQSLAIVGESGAGKSTLVQLALRFYDPIEGAVLIDDQDISKVTQASLRGEIGLVMQDTILLSGSVRHNMLFAKPEASEAEIIDALKHAEAWSFVSELPQGLDTILGERGASLSGGQKQRISIARVFLKDPSIVIFDEATSSLDSITEKQIQQTMAGLFEGRTSIIIAHRLSTIVDCDQIALLEKGRLTDIGHHAQLLKSSSRYRQMCQKQSMANDLLL